MGQRGLAPGALFGRYKVVRFLETTPTGACYEARPTVGGDLVVLKVGKEHLPAFKAEQQIAMALTHPNLQRGLDAGEVEGRRYLVLERVDGPTYAELLGTLRERKEPMPVTTAMWIAHRMLLGLQHAHGAPDKDGRPLGIVHRTITPRCVLLSRAGEVKLGGFAGAMMAGLDGRSTMAMLASDLAYVAPEQLAGHDVDARADLFSTALVLYEAISGVAASERTEQGKLLDQILGSRLTAPADLPLGTSRELSDLVMQSLAPEPDERFSSAEAFANALRSLLVQKCGEDLDAWAVQLGRLVESMSGSTEGPAPDRADATTTARRSEQPTPAAWASVPPSVPPRATAPGPVIPPLREPLRPPRPQPSTTSPRPVLSPPAPKPQPPEPGRPRTATPAPALEPAPAAGEPITPRARPEAPVPEPVQPAPTDPDGDPATTIPEPMQPPPTDPDGEPGPLLDSHTVAEKDPPEMSEAPDGAEVEPPGSGTATYGAFRSGPLDDGLLQPSITAETALLAIDEDTRASLAKAAGPAVPVDTALPTIRTAAVTGTAGEVDPAALPTIRIPAVARPTDAPAPAAPAAPPPTGPTPPPTATPAAPPLELPEPAARTEMLAIDDAKMAPEQALPPQPQEDPFFSAPTAMLHVEGRGDSPSSVDGGLEPQIGPSASVEVPRPDTTDGSRTELVGDGAGAQAPFRGWLARLPGRTTLLFIVGALLLGIGAGVVAALLRRPAEVTFRTGQLVDHHGWQLGLEGAGPAKGLLQIVVRVRHATLSRSPVLVLLQEGKRIRPRTIDVSVGQQPGEAVWRCLFPPPPSLKDRITLLFSPPDAPGLRLSIPLR